MGYPVECFCWIIAVNVAYISAVEDWILQKTTKKENGEMKYFTKEKNIIQWYILRFASNMWQEIYKYN